MNTIACTSTMETFGEVLQRRRLEKRWSISRLAREAGVTRQSIYRWEEDERVPTRPYILTLRTALGLSESDDGGWWRLDWS